MNSLLTTADKRRIAEEKADAARKEKAEAKKKQKRSDYKMGTQEFKDDAIPSKVDLERVDSPFDMASSQINNQPRFKFDNNEQLSQCNYFYLRFILFIKNNSL